MKRAATRPDEERALKREEELDSRRYPIAEDMALQCRIGPVRSLAAMAGRSLRFGQFIYP